MSVRLIVNLSLAVGLSAIIACGGGSMPSSHAGGDTLSFKYARLLTVVKYESHTLVTIADPWHKGKTLHRYALVRDRSCLVKVPPYTTVVEVPLRRVVPLSTVHAALMVDLGAGGAVAGIADLQYVKIPYVQQRCRSGAITDVGSSMNPDIERIINISSDAILVSPFENSGGYGRLEEIGVPIIECADYMEASALGRAEWMRFYGLLFGAERQADSLFAVVDSTYNSLKRLAGGAVGRVSVMMDKMTGTVWYVPGGRSTIGTMISDANAAYAFSANKAGGSLPLSFETMLDKCGDADVWLLRYSGKKPLTYAGLLEENQGYGEFKAFRSHKCYGCNLEQTRFYEETPFRPDFLLADFVRMVHPDIKGLGDLRYFHLLLEE